MTVTPNFQIGDVVRLKSLGVPMTVTGATYQSQPDEHILINVTWHDLNGEERWSSYDQRCLYNIDPHQV